MSFVTFEHKIMAQRAAEKKLRKEAKERERRETFASQYPNISYDDLRLQDPYSETDDSSIHYVHVVSNIVYSFDYEEKEWYQ